MHELSGSMRVLITRPEPAASAFADQLRDLGHEPVVEPMLSIVPMSKVKIDLKGVQALMLTSSNAVPAIPPDAHNLPVFAVGEATARAAEHAGCTAIEYAGGNGDALGRLAGERLDPQEGALLHLSGQDVRPGLEETLQEAGFTVRRKAVYKAEATEALTDDLCDIIEAEGLDAATFFSPRSASLFTSLAIDAGLEEFFRHADALCLSVPIAKNCRDLRWRRILIASRRQQESVVDLLDGPRRR